MLFALLSVAFAQDALTLPVGRVAVLAPQQAPTQVSIDRPAVIDVQPVMPWLIVTGKAQGKATLTMAHEAGQHRWAVTVGDAHTPLAGGSLLTIPTTPLPLAVDGGALVPWPADATALAVVKPQVVQVQAFGEHWLWVQGERRGVSDVVIERGQEAPDILTVTVGTAGPLPSTATKPANPLTVNAGGIAVVNAGHRPAAMLVAHPSRLSAVDDLDQPGHIRVKGLRAGTTWLVLGFNDGRVEVWPVLITAP